MRDLSNATFSASLDAEWRASGPSRTYVRLVAWRDVCFPETAVDFPLLIAYLRRPGGLGTVRVRLRRGVCSDGDRRRQVRALQRLVIMSLNPELPESGPFESRTAVAELYVEIALAQARADRQPARMGPVLLRATVLATAGVVRWGRSLRKAAACPDSQSARRLFDALGSRITTLQNRRLVDAGLHLAAHLATGMGLQPAALGAWRCAAEPSPAAYFTEAMMTHRSIGGRISARLPACPSEVQPDRLLYTSPGKPSLSVILTTGNRLVDLRRMLPSLAHQNLDGVEVIFSVFADGDNTATWLDVHMPEPLRRHAHILTTEAPRFSKARAQQMAVEGAAAPLLLFLDCDLDLLDPSLFQSALRAGSSDLFLMRSIEHRGMICTGAIAWRASQHVLDPVAERQLAGHPREIDDVIMIGEHLHRFGRYEMSASHRHETITLSADGSWTAIVTGGHGTPALAHFREDRTNLSRMNSSPATLSDPDLDAYYNQVADASPFLPELTRLRRYATRRRTCSPGPIFGQAPSKDIGFG